jgi:hypothetical protein
MILNSAIAKIYAGRFGSSFWHSLRRTNSYYDDGTRPFAEVRFHCDKADDGRLTGVSMNSLQKNSATMFVMRLLIAATLCMSAGATLADQVVGTIINLSGPLKVKKSDGSVKVLLVGDRVEQDDILITDDKTYAAIRFIDKSEITLRPGTVFKIKSTTDKLQRATP